MRFLLDTNIFSELLRPQPNAQLLIHFERYLAESGSCVLVLHELQFGWQRLPAGRRKDQIGRFIERVVGRMTLLSYDREAAQLHARLRAEFAQKGRVLPWVDGGIASIALAHQCVLVTRNAQDFAHIPRLKLANWFDGD